MRCSDLRAHIEAVKKVYPGKAAVVPAALVDVDDDDGEDAEDDDENGFSAGGGSSGGGGGGGDDEDFGDEADSSRLRDRIRFCRRELVDALGQSAFDLAYEAVKACTWDDDDYEGRDDAYEELSKVLTVRRCEVLVMVFF